MKVPNLKTLLFFMALLMSQTFLQAQTIVGRWQAGSAQLSNEYNENYQFYANGTFIFNTDGEDGLTRIMKISGVYHIDRDTILFSVRNYVELSGGTLKFTGTEPGESSWKFEGNVPKQVKLSNEAEQKGTFKIYKKQDFVILEIDGAKYYKVSDDPEKY
jgi:hypothetical protein